MVTNTYSSSVTLMWVLVIPSYTEITQVVVTYISEANFKTLDSGNMTVTDVENGSSPVSIAIGGLQPLTYYSFSVAAFHNVGTSSPVSVQAWTLPLSEYLIPVISH